MIINDYPAFELLSIFFATAPPARFHAILAPPGLELRRLTINQPGGVLSMAGDDAALGVPLCADNGTLIEGFGEQNDYNATCIDDNVRWAAHGATFAFQITDPVTQFELSATALTATPQLISIDIQASKQNDNGNLNLRALIFDFDANQYVPLIGVMPLSTTDWKQTFVTPCDSEPADFVDPDTNQVRILLQTIQTSGPPNVRTQIDKVLFNVN